MFPRRKMIRPPAECLHASPKHKGKPYCRGRVRSADIFFLALVLVISLMDMARVQTGVALSLNQSAKNLACTAMRRKRHWANHRWESWRDLSVPLTQRQASRGSRTEVSLTGSSYRDHIVELRAAGVYRFPVSFFGLSRVKVSRQRHGVHAWTGYRAEEDERSGKTEEMVYVADRRTVYHIYGDCSHLQLTIYCTEYPGVRDQRNERKQISRLSALR